MSRIIFYLDRYKYSVRFALDRIERETHDTTWAPVPRPALEKYLKIAGRLMFAGIDHALASQVCAALHTGSAAAFENEDAWRVTIDEVRHDKSYGALELIGVAKRTTVDFATLMFSWIRNPSTIPQIADLIAQSVTRQRDLLSYTYEAELAERLAKHVPAQPHLLPAQWRFAWGAESETTLLTNALALRCIYHVVAIHFGAGMNALRGGGLSNIVLLLSRDQLIADMMLMTSLGESKVRAYCNFLTWGFGTATPDPALQPLIPLGSGMLAIPCLHLLSSDQERNLLSLLARTDPQNFDSQSHLFEHDMVAALLTCNAPSGTRLRANIKVIINGEEEEVDVILLDEIARHIMICELRWMLGPGDPREVQNRKKACLEKVTQLRRKVERVSTQPDAVAATVLGLSPVGSAEGRWFVSGVVLIAGFAGTRSPDARYPIIPVRLFERALNEASSLSALAEWCHGATWQPKEGHHFNVIEQEIALEGSKPLRVAGLSIPDSAARFSSEALATLLKRNSATSPDPDVTSIDRSPSTST